MENIISEQLTLFKEHRLPNKPYCSDDKTARLIRSLRHARKLPYIQVNPPTLRFWMVFDVDRPGAALAWENANLPPPAWAAVDRQTTKGHLAYGLSAPVLTSEVARRDPLRFLCAIESAYREQLQADRGFAGLITKNPTHPLWRVLVGPQHLYELGELADWVDLPKHLPNKAPETVGLGRNCALFEMLRHWAYRHVRQFKGEPQGFVHWQQACYSEALNRNGDFLTPLWETECWHIAKSVAKWTWHRFDIEASDRKFSETQAHRGRLGGLAKGAKYASDVEKACYLKAHGWAVRAIAKELGVSKSWVSNVVSQTLK